MLEHLSESSNRSQPKLDQGVEDEGLDRRQLLKAAVGVGVAMTVGVAANPAAAQTSKECTLPPAPPLQENQIEVTVPEGRNLIVRKEGDPIAEVVVRVSDDVRKTARPVLVAIRDCCCCD